MAKILVWTWSISSRGNNKALNVGHAAMMIGEPPNQTYISWWPKGAAGLIDSTTRGHVTPSYDSDVASEGGIPAIINLSFLDDEAIVKWWSMYKYYGLSEPYCPVTMPTTNDYDLYKNNCSKIVLQAMNVGGANKIASGPSGSFVTPGDILNWAKVLLSKSRSAQYGAGSNSVGC